MVNHLSERSIIFTMWIQIKLNKHVSMITVLLGVERSLCLTTNNSKYTIKISGLFPPFIYLFNLFFQEIFWLSVNPKNFSVSFPLSTIFCNYRLTFPTKIYFWNHREGTRDRKWEVTRRSMFCAYIKATKQKI